MKSLMLLLQATLAEAGVRCRTSTTRDLRTVASRFEHEGTSFLTITLPTFGKDLEKGLEQGKVDRNMFQGFTWHAGLPRFLGGFLDLVFDRGTGRLLDDPSIDAIQAVRQITLMFGKVGLPCSEKRVSQAFDGFIETEVEVKHCDQIRTPEQIRQFRLVSSVLFSDVLQGVQQDIRRGRITAKHGPGATADKLRGNAKWNQAEWPWRLEEVFPSLDFLVPNERYYSRLDRVRLLDPGAERPVGVVAVPKTLKTPRLIAIEPTAMQYVQQGLARSLVDRLEADHLLKSMIGFTDQGPNQALAREGSLYGELATLDLSEASDRVSNQLVRALLAWHPDVARGVDACRSRKADVRGKVLRLAKFASMGSALTFPIEAMVFLTIVFVAVQKELGRQLTRGDIASLRGQVRVYGDDIVVPTRFVHAVIDELTAFGLKVNVNKSFWNGKFRESCGKEYYDGVDVSICRVRTLLPPSRRHAQEIISTASFRNQMYFAGWWQVARLLDEWMARLIPWPTVLPTSPVLGRWSFLGFVAEWTHPTLHVPMVRGMLVSAKIPESKLDDYGALMKVFTTRRSNDPLLGIMPIPDVKHLERAGRPIAVDIKHGRGPAV